MTEPDTQESPTGNPSANVSWRPIAHSAGLILLVILVLPFVIYLFPQLVGASQSYVVLSGSMEPVMSPGDVIIVEQTNAAHIAEGDIITFGGDGNAAPTTHRVINKTERNGEIMFETKGDANENPDSRLISQSEVKGKTKSFRGHILVVPLIGYVIEFAGTGLGRVLFLVVPLGLLAVNEIFQRNWDERQNDSTTVQEGEMASEPESESQTGHSQESLNDEISKNSTNSRIGSGKTAEVTFTPPELQLGLLTIIAFFIYSLWVVVQTTALWAFGVAGGVGAIAVLLSWFYFQGANPTDEGGEASTQTDEGEVVKDE